MPVVRDDVVSIPASASEGTLVTINWQQWTKDRDGQYYLFPGRLGDEPVVVFVQKEYFDDQTLGVNIRKQGTLVDNKISFKVDKKYQYGQKNEKGDARFLVYHDKSRNIYQHRFVSAINPAKGDKALKWMQANPDWGEWVTYGVDKLKAVAGDPLKTF